MNINTIDVINAFIFKSVRQMLLRSKTCGETVRHVAGVGAGAGVDVFFLLTSNDRLIYSALSFLICYSCFILYARLSSILTFTVNLPLCVCAHVWRAT